MMFRRSILPDLPKSFLTSKSYRVVILKIDVFFAFERVYQRGWEIRKVKSFEKYFFNNWTITVHLCSFKIFSIKRTKQPQNAYVPAKCQLSVTVLPNNTEMEFNVPNLNYLIWWIQLIGGDTFCYFCKIQYVAYTASY